MTWATARRRRWRACEALIAADHPEYVRHHLAKAEGRAVTDEEVDAAIADLRKGEVMVEVTRGQQLKTMLTAADVAVPFFFKRKWFLVQARTSRRRTCLSCSGSESFVGSSVRASM